MVEYGCDRASTVIGVKGGEARGTDQAEQGKASTREQQRRQAIVVCDGVRGQLAGKRLTIDLELVDRR